MVLRAIIGETPPESKDFHMGVEQFAHTHKPNPLRNHIRERTNLFFGNFDTFTK